ncbi:MAG: hypothetical protein HUU04_08270 [Verrucomicrobiae bacterium]|nr:hypothetical protein [Verrucomicrobiae bacterium]
MKPKSVFLSAFVLAVAFALAAPLLRAEGTPDAAAAAAPAKAPRVKPEKAEGAIEALDAAARTITLGGKSYKVAEKAKILVDGAPKTLADLQVGDAVKARYVNEADGAAVIKSIRKGKAPQRVKAADTTAEKAAEPAEAK